MSRLTKRDAEELIDLVDCDLQRVLTRMLRKVLDCPGAGWDALVAAAEFPPERAERLLARDQNALYELAAELNERRGLEPR